MRGRPFPRPGPDPPRVGGWPAVAALPAAPRKRSFSSSGSGSARTAEPESPDRLAGSCPAPLVGVPTNPPRLRMSEVDPAAQGQAEGQDGQERQEPPEDRHLTGVADRGELVAQSEER